MIRINFAGSNYRILYRITRGLFIASGLLVVVMVLFVWSAIATRAEIATLQVRISDAEARAEKLRPVMQERERVMNDLASMTMLVEAKRFSWTGMFTSIEGVFPTGVALTKIKYDPKGSALSLNGDARSPEALRNLVVGLEKSSAFRDPRLKHQSVEKGRISFNVTSIYQGPAGAGTGQAPRTGPGL